MGVILLCLLFVLLYPEWYKEEGLFLISRKAEVGAHKEPNRGLASKQTGVYSALVLVSYLYAVKICGDYGVKTLVLSCVDKIIEAGYGKLIYKLRTEVVDYEDVAFDILCCFGLIRTVTALETVVFVCVNDILRGIVKHLNALCYE